MESYFGESGIEYTLGRVPIASSDFSESEYSYNDTPNNTLDLNLTRFSVQMDEAIKIPFILRAVAKAKSRANNGSMALFASPWSPPAWMKSNNQRSGGHMKGAEEGRAFT